MLLGLDTLTFLFLFLPASMLVFYLCPSKYKNASLAVMSLLFYASNDWKNLPILLLSLLFDYLVCSKLVRFGSNQKGRRTIFWSSILKNILLMVLAMAMMELGWITMPLGLLVYTVTSMGYVIDVYNGDERFDGKIMDYLLFTCFFAKLYAGPIVQYSQLREQWENRDLSLERINTGMKLSVSGLAKIVILAGGNIQIQTAIQEITPGEESVLSVWFLIITSTFALYYTLTGYCDMARGLGNLFGMQLPENFHYPFQSRTVSDFFNRFNITVTQFINRYVYVFLGGDTNGVLSTTVNTLLTTMLMGLWFGIRLNYLVWGIYFAGFILLEKCFLMKYLQKIPPIFDRMYTFVVVMFSFTIFSGDSLKTTGYFLKSMFGLNSLPIFNNAILYILSANYLVILLSFFFATSLVSLIGKMIRNKVSHITEIGGTILYLGVFVATVSFMI